MKTNTVPFINEIVLQETLSPALTPVGANVDYERAKRELDDIERLLVDSGIESMAVAQALKGKQELSIKPSNNIAQSAIESIRTETLRRYLGGISFRALSNAICSSDSYARFCRAVDIHGIAGVSKSSLERASKFFDSKQLEGLLASLSSKCFSQKGSRELGLAKPLDTSSLLMDGTCLEANIHYPVDWVLLKDCAHTLLKAVTLIRSLGLRNRMPKTPEQFACEMNKLCIGYANTMRRKDGKKNRKKLLRKMFKLLDAVAGHARRHANLLGENLGEVDRSIAQARRICERIEGKLELLPKLKRQARERIIGERQVRADEKVLSIHDPDIRIIVKGKSGKPAEFGNQLLVCENNDGFIVDSKLYREQAPAEQHQLPKSLERIESLGVAFEGIVADRGFSSARNSRNLKEKAFEATAPRSVPELEERLKEPRFRALQKRRAGTEARIATLKNRWHGGRLRAKRFDNRECSVKGSILSRNLCLLSRLIFYQQLEAA